MMEVRTMTSVIMVLAMSTIASAAYPTGFDGSMSFTTSQSTSANVQDAVAAALASEFEVSAHDVAVQVSSSGNSHTVTLNGLNVPNHRVGVVTNYVATKQADMTAALQTRLASNTGFTQSVSSLVMSFSSKSLVPFIGTMEFTIHGRMNNHATWANQWAHQNPYVILTLRTITRRHSSAPQ
jgi:hypothetical protein